MRATLNIPDDLIDKVQKVTNQKSKTKAIIQAMEEFIRMNKIKELISQRGKIKIEYDWEKEEQVEIAKENERRKLVEK